LSFFYSKRYTSSSLKISLLSLFVKMMYKLPSFAMGVITRESVRTALLNGISAEQIISFIQQNVHEQVSPTIFTYTNNNLTITNFCF
jgi:hypothetical protein